MNEITRNFSELIKSGVISVTDGYRAKNCELGGTGLIFLRAGHVTDAHIDFDGVERFHEQLTPKLQDKTSRADDVIVTTKGNSTGRTSFVDGTMPTFVYSPHLSRWRVEDRSKIAPSFLRYWSRSPQFVAQMRGLAASTDMAPYLSLRDQQRLEITLPHIDEQRRIGEVLGSLDDKIEQNRRTSRALERLARAVFKAWFIDFEPVKAKAAGATSFPGMPPAAFNALPTRLTNSPLAPVPEGWEVGKLGDLIEIHDSKRIPLSKKQREERRGTFRYYGAAGVIDYVNDFLFDGIYVLTGEDGTVSNDDGTPVTQYVWGRFWVNNHAHVLTAKPPLTNEHLLLLLRSLQVKPFVTGAVQPKLSQTNMKSIPVIIPPVSLAKFFGKVIDPFFALARSLADESAKLATLRDYLLPRLLSGRVRVGEAEGKSEWGCQGTGLRVS